MIKPIPREWTLLKLLEGVRKHRDQRGDDRCWMDDEELYKLLPEGYTPPERDTCVELKNCERYIQCRHNPGTEYISPERRIEELEKENKQLLEDNQKLKEAMEWKNLYFRLKAIYRRAIGDS